MTAAQLENTHESARKIYATIKQRIVAWEYLPNHRITEEQITSEFHISRSPAREALQMLIENGYVVKEAFKGYHVVETNLKFIQELYEFRLALELYTVSKAAEEMAEADWQKLYAYWGQDPENISANADTLANEDEQFHLIIAQQTRNSLFLERLEVIFERLRIIRIYDFSSKERTVQTFNQHKKILECIKSHQVNDAQSALIANIKSTENSVEQSVAFALSKAYLRT